MNYLTNTEGQPTPSGENSQNVTINIMGYNDQPEEGAYEILL